MTTSVCMTTYNGEKYIEEQLMSILHQTHRAEEVILCDDNSTDQTVAIIGKFVEDHSLQDSWKLYQNEENKGYPGNFYYAMSLCSKDVVFLADQDDIWHVKKLERMCRALADRPAAKAICCKFGLIDAEGEAIFALMAPSHSRETGKLREVEVGEVFYKCEWPGMVVAYRNEWYQQWQQHSGRHDSIIPYEYNSNIPHDFLVCARAAEEKGFWQVDEVLAYHRRHDSNAGGEEHRIRRLLNKSRKLTEIKNYLQILEAFQQEKVLQTEAGRAALDEKYCTMKDRYEALNSGKVSQVLRNAGRHRGNVRLATLLCDLVIVRE